MPATIWKILSKNSPGTATTFAADDWDMPGRYMNDVDLSATAPSSIKTNTSFWDNRLRIWNPAKTFAYRLRSLAILGNYDITLPLISSNDEFQMLLASQTPQNKTINLNNNTVTATGASAGGIPRHNGTKYVNQAIGGAGQVPTVNAGGTDWIWSDPTAINIADNAVSTAKILDSAVTTTKIADNNITAPKILDSTITSAKLEGSIGQEKLSKITDITKLPDYVRYDWPRYKHGQHNLTTGGSGDGIFGGFITSTGTHSRVLSSGTGVRARWTTGTTIGNQGGFRTNDVITRADNNPRLEFKISYDTTNLVLFVGLSSQVASAFPSGTSPLDNHNGIGVFLNTAFTNVRVARNSNDASQTSSDLSSTTTIASGGVHTFVLYTDNSGTSWHVTFDGTDNLVTTDLPGVTASLGITAYVETTAAAAKAMDVRYFFTTMDPG